jgi:ubiquinone/menaquinone biosynthesis C-methylase UbiE
MGDAETEYPFDPIYADIVHVPAIAEIWRAVYGEEYSDITRPFSFVTLTDLRRLIRSLDLGPTSVFLDVACGQGGPGLWMSRESGARVIGMDLSRVAIRQAAERASELGLGDRVRYHVADATALGIEATSVDAVVCIDALQVIAEPGDACREAHRVLKPGGGYGVTTWRTADHAAVLEEAGFVVELDETIAGWHDYQRRIWEAMLARRAEITSQVRPEVAAPIFLEAEEFLANPDPPERAILIARKRS